MKAEERPKIEGEDPPPIGRTWNRLYAAVLINLAVLVLIFWVFTVSFR